MNSRFINKRSSGSVYVIAEIGINHNGKLAVAKELILQAVDAGADAVKFQVRNLDEIYVKSVLEDSRNAEQGTQYLLSELKKAHLSYDEFRELAEFSKSYDVDFFATPFDVKSAVFLNDIGIKLFKIGSPDFTNLPLIKAVCDFKKPVILSTGMSDESEIQKLIQFLKNQKADFSLLHCNSTYPAAYHDINLRYLTVMAAISGVTVGYSGHEQGYAVTLAAVALGAKIIERHITKDRTLAGPDHSSSLEFSEFKAMVQAVRQVEESLGEAHRIRSQGELNNKLSLSKSLVASQDLLAGTLLSATDFSAKTPAKGISPLELENLIGKTLNKDLKKDDYFYLQDIENHKSEIKRDYEINKHWGIVGRLNDFRDYIDLKPKLIEIHMTWRDLTNYRRPESEYDQDLVVHAPEYYEDKLIDFTSEDPIVTEYSIEMLNRTIAIARDLNNVFKGQKDARGPRVVVHPGGHFVKMQGSDRHEQYRILAKRLREIDTDGVQVLVENMPPFPWYFGGQWYNTIFMDGKEIAQFAKQLGWGICYDTSHALLYCNSMGIPLRQFTKDVFDHVSYLHISDAKGATAEGLQLGHGDMADEDLAEILGKLNVGFIPEIWQGHLNKGHGFKEALSYIENLLKKSSGLSCSENCNDPTHLHAR